MNETDKLLLDLTNNMEEDLGNDDKALVQAPLQIEDISDLVSDRTLSNTDYLVLTSLTEGKSFPTISTQYGVTETYIKKLQRSNSAKTFLKEIASQKLETATDLANTQVAKGMEVWQQHLEGLLEKGNTDQYLYSMFGKSSFQEVASSLTKQQAGEEPETGNELQQFFQSITVNTNG